MTTDLFLSRAEHDALMDRCHGDLLALFQTCESRSWSLAGVEFRGVDADLVKHARAALA